MSNDWWTNSTSSSHGSTQTQSNGTYFTPQRQNTLSRSQRYAYGSGQGQGQNVGDELDSEDLKMVDSIKFLPSFANSPAGKLALGSSPQNQNQFPSGATSSGNNASQPFGSFGAGGAGTGFNQGGMGMSIGSPGSGNNNNLDRSEQGRRSPGVSTSMRERERDSPRHHRRSLLHQNSQLGNSFAGPGGAAYSQLDEDMPPTASLRDSISGNGGGNSGGGQVRNSNEASALELPTPQTLLPSSNTTTLHIFGPPVDVLSTLKPYLGQFGNITSFAPGPEGSNWYIVTYDSPISASYALRRHGDILNGRYMIGFKVHSDSSSNGCTLSSTQNPNSNSTQNQQLQGNNNSGAGTPIRIQDKSIIKPRQQPPNHSQHSTSATTQRPNNDYAWDDNEEQASGWSGWVSERLFGR
uniref:RRM Nup35-type domain-containing protein n=1 Tax=Kwoniella dejecticola CBS 10117 TaxID=1296121 RepID=A0A1A5ZWT0_9TREE|nr:uncharacterized protein I303_07018 [Kwoniella dejecticola CBS 10117]OBR82259.1 hypothetical protein I303_07018 [Kwoniella dejecticola CBS 10117]